MRLAWVAVIHASRLTRVSQRGHRSRISCLSGLTPSGSLKINFHRPFSRGRSPRENWGGRWDSNPRRPGSQPGALPTELRPPRKRYRTTTVHCQENLARPAGLEPATARLSLPTTAFAAPLTGLWSGLSLHHLRCRTYSLYGTPRKSVGTIDVTSSDRSWVSLPSVRHSSRNGKVQGNSIRQSPDSKHKTDQLHSCRSALCARSASVRPTRRKLDVDLSESVN